jgi:hypothetical protein
MAGNTGFAGQLPGTAVRLKIVLVACRSLFLGWGGGGARPRRRRIGVFGHPLGWRPALPDNEKISVRFFDRPHPFVRFVLLLPGRSGDYHGRL